MKSNVIEKFFLKLTRFIRLTTMASLFLLVLTMTAVVVLRYFFNSGWVWLQELCIYLHAFTFLMGCAYTLRKNQHVRVDIFYEKLPKGKINFFGGLFFGLPFFLLILYTSFEFTKQGWLWLEKSADSGGLPLVFILKSFIPLFALILIFEILYTHLFKGQSS